MASKQKKIKKKKIIPSAETTTVMVKRSTHKKLVNIRKKERFISMDQFILDLIKNRKVKQQ